MRNSHYALFDRLFNFSGLAARGRKRRADKSGSETFNLCSATDFCHLQFIVADVPLDNGRREHMAHARVRSSNYGAWNSIGNRRRPVLRKPFGAEMRAKCVFMRAWRQAGTAWDREPGCAVTRHHADTHRIRTTHRTMCPRLLLQNILYEKRAALPWYPNVPIDRWTTISSHADMRTISFGRTRLRSGALNLDAAVLCTDCV